MASRRLKKIFFFCILIVLLNSFTTHAKPLSIHWNPKTIEQTVVPGDTVTLITIFTSEITLHNVDLWVTPELQPFVTVIPNHFETIRANTAHAIAVRISITNGLPLSLYEGTIHAKSNSITFPQTLKIKLNTVESALYDNWMITFTHRGVPLPEEAVGFICNTAKSEIISWLKREADKYQHEIPFHSISCLEEQILLTGNLLVEDMPGFCLNRPEVINFLEGAIPIVKDQKFVTVVHYLDEYEGPFYTHSFDSRYDFYFFKKWLPLYPPLGIDWQGESFIHELMHKLGASDKYYDGPDHACRIDPATGQEYNGYDIMCHRVSDPTGGYRTPTLSELIITEPTAREIGWLP